MFKPKIPQTIHHFLVQGSVEFEVSAYEVILSDGVLCFKDHDGTTIQWVKDWRTVREIRKEHYTAIT